MAYSNKYIHHTIVVNQTDPSNISAKIIDTATKIGDVLTHQESIAFIQIKHGFFDAKYAVKKPYESRHISDGNNTHTEYTNKYG